MTETILVTGSTGFVGACLAKDMLKKGNEVHVIIRKNSNTWRIKDIIKDLNIHYGDITHNASIESVVKDSKPKTILHLATYGGYPFQKDNEKIMETNLKGTFNLLKACPNDISMFINTGSSSEYGIKSSSMKETDILEPVNFYGTTKAASTILCQTWSKQNNIPLITFRLFSVYGYYEDPSRLIPQTIVSCLKRTTPKVDTPNSVRDFIFIEDIVEAYNLASKISESRGEIFNLGSGKQSTVRYIVDEISKITKSNTQPEYTNKLRWKNEPSKWIADISKAKKLFNWQPKNDINQGLRKTIEWFKENMRLYEKKI